MVRLDLVDELLSLGYLALEHELLVQLGEVGKLLVVVGENRRHRFVDVHELNLVACLAVTATMVTSKRGLTKL